MKSIQSLPVDAAVARRLALHLRDHGGPQDVADVVAAAITFWLDDQARQASGAEPPIQHGYQWKSLFLPEGTQRVDGLVGAATRRNPGDTNRPYEKKRAPTVAGARSW